MRETETKVLPVLEMSCAVCAGNVESTVQALSGVEKASVNFAAGTLTVTYNPSVITLEVMQAAVQAAGYDLIVEAEDPVAMQEEKARMQDIEEEYHRSMDVVYPVGAFRDGVHACTVWKLDHDGVGIGYYDLFRTFVLCERCAACPQGKSQYGHIGRT